MSQHRPLVSRIVRGLGVHRAFSEDLESEGVLGLIEASRRFDPSAGVKFATYASWWIVKRVREAAAAQATVVRVPRHRIGIYIRLRDAELELRAVLARTPTADEVAAKAGISLSQVHRYRSQQPRAVSLDDPISEGGTLRVADTLAERTAPPADDVVIAEDCLRCIARMVPLLPERHRDVIVRRYGLDGRSPRSLASIAGDYGVSRERIHQLERQALDKLRSMFDWTPASCAEVGGAMQ